MIDIATYHVSMRMLQGPNARTIISELPGNKTRVIVIVVDDPCKATDE